MKHELPKALRRRMRELHAKAYERDLADELSRLESEFVRWHSDESTVFELSAAIHRFHQGPSRELYTRYNGQMLELVVADAICRGLLTKAEVGAEILEILSQEIAFWNQQREESQGAAGIEDASDDAE